MQIVGHGIDIVSIARIQRILDEHRQRFLERCFTAAESSYCTERRNTAQHLAARFAAKEAVLKALGTGLTGGIAWTDIEVVRLADGRPTLALRGEAARSAAILKADEWWLSMSHTDDHAVASAIAVSPALGAERLARIFHSEDLQSRRV
jgi:holo-[acyl-carrier protein] synthase